MAIRRITIGRSPHSDIQLDIRHEYASNCHGELHSDGNRIFYRDISTNGTLVNNTWVRHRSVPVCRGDIILIACRYLIDWNTIDAFLPASYGQARVDGWPRSPLQYKQKVEGSWNWGAMGLYPLWGLRNGCWWALPTGIAVGWLFPLPNLVFGYYGNQWALQYGQWPSMQQFLQEQAKWKGIGIMAMCVMMILFLWWVSIYAVMIFY